MQLAHSASAEEKQAPQLGVAFGAALKASAKELHRRAGADNLTNASQRAVEQLVTPMPGSSVVQASAAAWVDRLWRSHRQALVPSDEVVTRMGLALSRLRHAILATDASPDAHMRHVTGQQALRHDLLALRAVHDTTTAHAAATASAQLLGGAGGEVILDDLEVDTSGASAPARVVESVRMLSESLDRLSAIGSGRQQQPVSPILFIYPAELPGMPLLIAAAWSDGVQAYSLPMLMQTETSPQSWQHSLAAGLRMGLGAVVRGGSHPTVNGKERWLSQAAEVGISIVSDKLLGYSASSTFHDVAIVRCDAADAKTFNLFGGGGPHVGVLRHVYYGALLAGLPRGSAVGHLGSDQFAQRPSFSYMSSGQLRCPATAADLAESPGLSVRSADPGSIGGGVSGGGAGKTHQRKPGGKGGRGGVSKDKPTGRKSGSNRL